MCFHVLQKFIVTYLGMVIHKFSIGMVNIKCTKWQNDIRLCKVTLNVPVIFSYIAKELLAILRKTSCLEMHLVLFFFGILKTVLVVDLTFQCWVSIFKNGEFMDKIVWIFLLKLAKKSYAVLQTWTSKPVHFLKWRSSIGCSF